MPGGLHQPGKRLRRGHGLGGVVTRAAQARERYDFHRARQVRDAMENEQRLEAKALAKLADLPAHTHDASGAEADRKRAVIEAALARAKARRGNG